MDDLVAIDRLARAHHGVLIRELPDGGAVELLELYAQRYGARYALHERVSGDGRRLSEAVSGLAAFGPSALVLVSDVEVGPGCEAALVGRSETVTILVAGRGPGLAELPEHWVAGLRPSEGAQLVRQGLLSATGGASTLDRLGELSALVAGLGGHPPACQDFGRWLGSGGVLPQDLRPEAAVDAWLASEPPPAALRALEPPLARLGDDRALLEALAWIAPEHPLDTVAARLVGAPAIARLRAENLLAPTREGHMLPPLVAAWRRARQGPDARPHRARVANVLAAYFPDDVLDYWRTRLAGGPGWLDDHLLAHVRTVALAEDAREPEVGKLAARFGAWSARYGTVADARAASVCAERCLGTEAAGLADRLVALRTLAELHRLFEQESDALRCAETAATLASQVTNLSPPDRAVALVRFADMLCWVDRAEEALDAFARAEEALAGWRGQLAHAYVLRHRSQAEALPVAVRSLRSAIGHLTRVVASDGANPAFRRHLGNALLELAETLLQLRRLGEVPEPLGQARRIMEELRASEVLDPEHDLAWIRIRLVYADSELTADSSVRAEHLADALSVARAQTRRDPGSPRWWLFVSNVAGELSNLDGHARRFDQALIYAEEDASAARNAGELMRWVPRARRLLARSCTNAGTFRRIQGDLAGARELYLEAAELYAAVAEVLDVDAELVRVRRFLAQVPTQERGPRPGGAPLHGAG